MRKTLQLPLFEKVFFTALVFFSLGLTIVGAVNREWYAVLGFVLLSNALIVEIAAFSGRARGFPRLGRARGPSVHRLPSARGKSSHDSLPRREPRGGYGANSRRDRNLG